MAGHGISAGIANAVGSLCRNRGLPYRIRRHRLPRPGLSGLGTHGRRLVGAVQGRMCTSAATDSADMKAFPATASGDRFTALLEVIIETYGLVVIGAGVAALEPEGHSNALASALATSLLASPTTSVSWVRAATISTLVGGETAHSGPWEGAATGEGLPKLGCTQQRSGQAAACLWHSVGYRSLFGPQGA